MSIKDDLTDGGPAFPQNTVRSTLVEQGMSLRDYFAGQVLAGWGETYHRITDRSSNYGAREIARTAYSIADALLTEREKP
jgi:hypothetical protein